MLWSLVDEIKRDDLMAAVTVVSPSRYASLALRQDLGDQGFINVRFIQIPVLSELLGGATLAALKKKPITATLQSISLRQALSESTGLLQPVRQHARTRDSVRDAFRELRRLEETDLEDLASQGGITAEVVSLFRKHRQAISGAWFDSEDLSASAAEAVREGHAAALDDLGHVIFFLPRLLSSGETGLVLALASDKRCSVILGITGDDQADRLIRGLQTQLETVMGEGLPVDDSGSSDPPPMNRVHLHVAPSTHEEMRRVVRQIVAEAGCNGTPFHRMAVLYRMENPYGTLIRDELAMSGIPMAGPGRDLLADTPAGRTLLGLLDLPANDFRRDEVMEWLTGCPAKPPDSLQDSFSPSQWDAISRQSGIVGGLEQWRERLSSFDRATREQAEQGERDGSITEARATAMRNSANAALALRRFVLELAQSLDPPVGGSYWATFCDWQSKVFRDYLARPTADTEGDELEGFDRDVERVLQLLKEIESADSLKSKPTAEEFRQVVRDALQVSQGHLGPTGQGVYVSSFANAAGMSFERVWLVGMIEGATPPALRPDPLLPQGDLAGRGNISRAQRRISEERYNYLSALAAAPSRTLSYPVSESSSRRAAHPSPWFLEQASILAERQVHSGDLPSLAGEPWLSVTKSAEDALDGLVDDSLADLLDYRLDRLVRWKKSGNPIAFHPLVTGGILSRSVRMGRERRSRRFTQYDGNLGQTAAAARYSRNLDRQPISPTRLEAWATCPFSYFLGNVLRLGSLATPEDTTSITPLERGKLIHKILEEFIVQSRDKGLLPPPGQSWVDSDKFRLLEIAETEFNDAEARGVAGKRLLWQLEKQNIRDDLDAFLVAEASLRESIGTGEIRVEAPFGLGNDSPEVVDEATGLRFRGIIDRVDTSADGRSLLVMDYKTGSPSPYGRLKDDPIDRGKRLQLGIYSLAAQRLAPAATDLRAAYWLTSGRGEFKFAPPDHFDIGDPDTARRFRDGVTTVVSGIRKGVFPANPGEMGRDGFVNCHFCDFSTLCPSRRGDVWERKKNDEAAAIYRELAEGDSPAEEQDRE
jgi:RecB family exonuclease